MCLTRPKGLVDRPEDPREIAPEAPRAVFYATLLGQQYGV